MSRYDLNSQTYDSTQVCRLVGITPRQLRYWLKLGLVTPSVQTSRGRMGRPNIYSQSDLYRVKKIVFLMKREGSLQKARRVLAAEDRLLEGAAGR